MPNEMLPESMQHAWQNQPVPALPSPQEIRQLAGRFRSQIGRRNLREYAVSALLIPYFGYFAVSSALPMMKAGNALMLAGLLYMMYQLYRRAGVQPADLGSIACLQYHRQELVRQRDALRGVWTWYLGPLVPGLATIAASACLAGFQRSPQAGMLGLGLTGLVGLVLFAVARINYKAASELQRTLDALPSQDA